MGNGLKMNEAQLPEVTNVPNDLCPDWVALFSSTILQEDSGGGANPGAALC